MPTFATILKPRNKTHTGVVKSKMGFDHVVTVGGVDRTIRSSVGDLAPGSNVVITETKQGWFIVAPGTLTGRKTLEVNIDG